MKILDRIGLALFSSLMLIISIIVCLMIFGWLNVDLVHQFVVMAINDSVSSNIMLGLSIAFILLAIKCIFFDSSSKQEMDYKNGILLENSDGKLLITKDTIENLVNSVVKGFDSAENVTTRVELDNENNVTVFVNGSETGFYIDLDAEPDYFMGHLVCIEVDCKYKIEVGGFNG